MALEIFHFQAKNNQVYAKYLEFTHFKPDKIVEIGDIPFLPIELFKTLKVTSSAILENTLFFSSSSTTGQGISHHFVPDIEHYKMALRKSFEYQFGDIERFTFRFLLPSYLEREGSSLVFMAEELVNISKKGGFYLHNMDKLAHDLENDIKNNYEVILLSVSFALMDFAEKFPMDLSKVIVMETGGMKGRRAEIIRNELHSYLKKQLNSDKILSEYGMTELFSQVYSSGDGIFECPPWMKVIVNQTTDPFCREKTGRTGCINIIDLANIDSCCFIATTDLGRVYKNGCFEVLGRYDHSDVRGCNLMID